MSGSDDRQDASACDLVMSLAEPVKLAEGQVAASAAVLVRAFAGRLRTLRIRAVLVSAGLTVLREEHEEVD